ncbi:hypothetical protein CRUP_017178, partial [Coryphaenoides rupestris]
SPLLLLLLLLVLLLVLLSASQVVSGRLRSTYLAMELPGVLRQLWTPEMEDLRQYVRTVPTNVLMGMSAVAAVTTYWYATRPRAVAARCDLHMQSLEVPGTEGVRRSTLRDELLTHFYDDALTVYQVFLRGLRVSNDGPCLGSRKPNQPYEWLSYSEWTIIELACYTYSLVAVPLYDTLGTDAIDYIIDKASISTVFCDVVDKVKLILGCISGKEHPVKTVVVMEPADDELVALGATCGVHILSLADIEDLGQANYRKPIKTLKPTSNDVHISFLPLAHMFERVVEGVVLIHGGRIGFFQGDIRLLMDDMKTLRPTVFPIFGMAGSPLKRWLLDFASRRKMAEFKSGVVRKDSMWDTLIFQKIQSGLGGRVRLMITGAAPVSPVVLSFLRTALSCQFYEGYGQTECTAGCSMTVPGDFSAGHVGPPLPCNLIKLVDVPEMNYLAANGEGEVCVKGPNVFQGYLRDPEKTAEALDQDGWLHMGDIGKWLPNGTLKLIDRKKNLFKLAQGEYIAPEKIENVYIRCDKVAQIFVHGDSLQACLVAIVVPDPDFLPGWAKQRGLEGSYTELCQNKDVKKGILDDMLRLGKEGGLKSFEQVRDIMLHAEMFTVQNGLLTPTLKAKRYELLRHFREHIDVLYAGIKI